VARGALDEAADTGGFTAVLADLAEERPAFMCSKLLNSRGFRVIVAESPSGGSSMTEKLEIEVAAAGRGVAGGFVA
jgi:hypothetical protein